MTCLAFSSDGKKLAAGSYSSIDLWDLISGKKICSYDQPRLGRWGCKSLDFSPDGKWVVGAGHDTDGGLVILDAQTGKEKPLSKRPTGWLRSVSFAFDGKLLAGASKDGLTFWSADDGSFSFALSK